MKKILSIMLAMILVLSLAGCGKEDKDLLSEIKERGYITIATEGDWSPWTYHDEKTGELTGFDVEVGKLIAEYLGVEAKFEETTWDSILAGVESGRFDLACNGVGYTEERAQTYNFSDPYVYTKKVLIVPEDNTDIKTFEDLKGKTTANTASSTYASIGEEYGATVTPVDSLGETIELVTAGRVDATVNAEVSFLDYMQAHPDAPIKIVASLEPDKVCYPVAKNDNTRTLLEEINKCLKQLRESGKLAEVSEQFFFGDITNP